jgi:DNA processing protein
VRSTFDPGELYVAKAADGELFVAPLPYHVEHMFVNQSERSYHLACRRSQRERSMGRMTTRHAVLLGLAEILSPSLNGPSSYALSELVELGVLDDRAVLGTVEAERRDWFDDGVSRLSDDRVRFWQNEVERLADLGTWIVDAAQAAYPVNLRMIHNRPPFLMVRGTLVPEDDRAIAVVGTRKPSEEGRRAAYRLAGGLAKRGVTVVSGLAEGIDTAAHSGAISAGGRTIAVFGTGIETVFPPQNRVLAGSVSASGACVSQFLPGTRGARWTFPVRNLVTSGLSLGTVVVEAGETSGARLQAEAAVLHGKRVFLPQKLLRTRQWARDILRRPGVTAVDSVDDVIDAVELDLLTDASVLL